MVRSFLTRILSRNSSEVILVRENGQKSDHKSYNWNWGQRGCGVAFILLAEAHLAATSSLGHADVVNHEVVDVKVIGATTTNLFLGYKNISSCSRNDPLIRFVKRNIII
jgi:hypothetical protein